MDVGADLKYSQPLAYSLGFLRPLLLPSSASPALACPGFFRFAIVAAVVSVHLPDFGTSVALGAVHAKRVQSPLDFRIPKTRASKPTENAGETTFGLRLGVCTPYRREQPPELER
jgi:hypothetical protein